MTVCACLRLPAPACASPRPCFRSLEKGVHERRQTVSLGAIEWKGRPVSDMRETNFCAIKDAYPLTTQTDILARLQGAKYITVVDG